MIETKGVNDWLNWCNISWHFPPPFLSEQIGIHWCFAQRVTRGTETVRLNLPQRSYLFIHTEEKQDNFFWHCRKNHKKKRLCGLVLVRDKLSSLCSRGRCITNISGRWKLLSSFHLCLPPEYSDGITHSSALCRADGIWAIRPSAGSAETKEINSFVITETQQRFVECFCWRLRGSSVEAESP